jgi:hypothetical protein
VLAWLVEHVLALQPLSDHPVGLIVAAGLHGPQGKYCY